MNRPRIKTLKLYVKGLLVKLLLTYSRGLLRNLVHGYWNSLHEVSRLQRELDQLPRCNDKQRFIIDAPQARVPEMIAGFNVLCTKHVHHSGDHEHKADDGTVMFEWVNDRPLLFEHLQA